MKAARQDWFEALPDLDPDRLVFRGGAGHGPPEQHRPPPGRPPPPPSAGGGPPAASAAD